MNKAKYESLDSRTGYGEGELVELTKEELDKLPFNAKMKLLEPVDEEEVIAKKLSDQDKEDLRALLGSLGLSKGRVEKVTQKYHTIAEMESHSNNAGIDSLTDKWIKEQFAGKKKESTKKSKKESEQ